MRTVWKGIFVDKATVELQQMSPSTGQNDWWEMIRAEQCKEVKQLARHLEDDFISGIASNRVNFTDIWLLLAWSGVHRRAVSVGSKGIEREEKKRGREQTQKQHFVN